jgi:hypothetical protein
MSPIVTRPRPFTSGIQKQYIPQARWYSHARQSSLRAGCLIIKIQHSFFVDCKSINMTAGLSSNSGRR